MKPPDLDEYISSDKFLLVKGFASRLPPNYEISLGFIELASQFNVLAFDGDALETTSFTKCLAAVAYFRSKTISVYLFALKY